MMRIKYKTGSLRDVLVDVGVALIKRKIADKVPELGEVLNEIPPRTKRSYKRRDLAPEGEAPRKRAYKRRDLKAEE